MYLYAYQVNTCNVYSDLPSHNLMCSKIADTAIKTPHDMHVSLGGEQEGT